MSYMTAQMRELGFEIQQHARTKILIEETIKTAEIEGERLDSNAVRSSVARRLGLPSAGLPVPRSRTRRVTPVGSRTWNRGS